MGNISREDCSSTGLIEQLVLFPAKKPKPISQPTCKITTSACMSNGLSFVDIFGFAFGESRYTVKEK